MSVANLELCKELYALSEWITPVGYTRDGSLVERGPKEDVNELPMVAICSAYDLGYLLRKLPYCQITRFSSDKYKAVWTGDDKMLVGRSTTSAENAIARLCIQLFKQNILQPSVTDKESI